MLKNKGGFTLIELVMIIIILGILAAVALPKYQDLAKDARNAVVAGTAGALRSNAIILFAKAKGQITNTFNSVRSFDYDTTNISITGTCLNATVTYLNSDSSMTGIDLSEYCSN